MPRYHSYVGIAYRGERHSVQRKLRNLHTILSWSNRDRGAPRHGAGADKLRDPEPAAE